MYQIARLGEGLLLNFSLSSSIGAQNTFLLQQAILKRNSMLKLSSICIAFNLAVLAMGTFGMQGVFALFPSTVHFLLRGGALYLLGYGLYSLYVALFKKVNLNIQIDVKKVRVTTVSSLIFITLLNPGLYIDVLVVIGARVNQYTGLAQNFFIGGLVIGEICWVYGFSLLAFCSSKFLQKPLIWRLVNFISAIIMITLAIHFYTMNVSVVTNVN